MPLPRLILASASPRRQELLRQCGVEFEVRPAQVRELHQDDLTARELCLLNAHRKARAVAKACPDQLVLGADTLVALGRQLFGKPAHLDEAQRMLAALQGRTHEVITGVCLMELRAHRERLFAEATEVTFKALDAAAIRTYLTQINPLDKAGAYAIQEHGEHLVSRLSGSYSNVVGLPVERLLSELESWQREEDDRTDVAS